MKWRAAAKWLALSLMGIGIVVSYASYFGDDGKGEVTAAKTALARHDAPSSQQQRREPQAAEVSRIEIERLTQQRTGRGGAAISNAFTSKSWYVAPPPPPPAPPPEPTAPPLPFSYLGRYEDSPAVVVVLAKGDRVYTVAEGEVIDGTYRVDRITDDAVRLVYLPLNITQSLSTQAAPENNQQPRNGLVERYGRP